MRLFLDSSVLLAASGSHTGASRLLIEEAEGQNWELVSSLYCAAETQKNLGKLGAQAEKAFTTNIITRIDFSETIHVSDRPLIFPVAKDRPIVATALALQADALLTLDRADFQKLLGNQVYGMWILTPGDWIRKWRQDQAYPPPQP